MKNLIYSIFSTFYLFPYFVYANESFSVEIEALTLMMKEYKNNISNTNETKFNTPSYMAYKKDECNAKVEITEKNGLQITAMQSFNVNICKKEIYKTSNN